MAIRAGEILLMGVLYSLWYLEPGGRMAMAGLQVGGCTWYSQGVLRGANNRRSLRLVAPPLLSTPDELSGPETTLGAT